MKDKKVTETEGTVKVKRKSIYYIIIAACALVLAAAIALTVIFVTMDNKTIDKPDDPSGTEEPDDNEDPDDNEPDEPSDVEVVLSLPVQDATIGTTYTFWYNSTLNRYNLHQGIDFKADAGTEVTAAYAGTVESISDTLLEGGKVVIDHGNGLMTEYASIDVFADLKVGDRVEQGDLIGTVSAAADAMGNEYNEGAHLHFAVSENGKNIDPSTYLDLDEK